MDFLVGEIFQNFQVQVQKHVILSIFAIFGGQISPFSPPVSALDLCSNIEKGLE